MSYGSGYVEGYGGVGVYSELSLSLSASVPKKGLPNITWLIDGREVPVGDDWRATTVVNGGYDTATLMVPESYERRFPSSFDVGVTARAYDDSSLVWEGDIVNAPTPEAGVIQVVCSGGRDAAEERDEALLYQDRDTSIWQDENGAPHDGAGKATIKVSATDGMLSWTSDTGEIVALNDSHAIVRWASGSLIRRLRTTLVVSGTATGYELAIEKFTGPAGTRTAVGTFTLTAGTKDITITSPTDAIAVILRRTGATHTRADTLEVILRDVRINDLTLADSFDVPNIITDIGRRLGYDPSGLALGVPIDSLGSNVQRITQVPIYGHVRRKSLKNPWGRGRILDYKTTLIEEQIKRVVEGPLNFLPFYWRSSWAEALNYLTEVLDWRWRVLGNANGRGRVLDAGAWGPTWTLSEGSAQVALKRLPLKNRVVVKWITPSGVPQQVIAHADPDPYELSGRVRAHKETLADPQASSAQATGIANLLLQRVSEVRAAGRIDITGLQDSAFSPYSVVAGDVVNAAWWGPGAESMRVAQTEMGSGGVSLGIEQPISIVNMLALAEQARARNPFGVLRHYQRFPRGDSNFSTYVP